MMVEAVSEILLIAWWWLMATAALVIVSLLFSEYNYNYRGTKKLIKRREKWLRNQTHSRK